MDITRGPQYVGTNLDQPGTSIGLGGYSLSGWYSGQDSYNNNISYAYNRQAGYNDNESGNKTAYVPYKLGRRGVGKKSATAFDPIWWDFECGNDNAKWVYLYQTARIKYTVGGSSDGVYSGRHDGAINVAGADGHVERFKLPRVGAPALSSTELMPWNADISGSPSQRYSWP
jgi:prepilin-type processing-associated H-X9-DG protein